MAPTWAVPSPTKTVLFQHHHTMVPTLLNLPATLPFKSLHIHVHIYMILAPFSEVLPALLYGMHGHMWIPVYDGMCDA